jgi:hypothetical protein
MVHATTLAEIVPEFADPVEILGNLLYLIRVDATNSRKIIAYAEMADEPLRRITKVIQRELAFGGNCPMTDEKRVLPTRLAS